ncbi:hypothetical protein Vafri_15434, partial [Volvox africanus]
SQGVRIKGTRLASMLDGVMGTNVPHLFRVHSTSGQAEWWPVDMVSGLCACPNDSDVCSHIFGVCCLVPRYRIRTATLVKARELVRVAGEKAKPVDDVIDDLTHCIRRWTDGAATAAGAAGPGAGYGDSVDPYRLCAEVAVALLLQGVVESADVYGPGRRNGPRRRIWWQRAIEASGAMSPSSSLDPPRVSRQRLGEEVQRQLAALVAAMEAELTTAAAAVTASQPQHLDHQQGGPARSPPLTASGGPAVPSPPPPPPAPRSVLAFLLELERATCTALGIDALSSAESWTGPRSREGGGGGGFARLSAGDMTPTVSGGDVSGSEGLLALLAEGGAAMAELLEKACGLALALGRVGAASTGGAAVPAGDAASAAAAASTTAGCTTSKEDLATAGGTGAGSHTVHDDDGGHGGDGGAGARMTTEAPVPDAAVSGFGANGGEGGVSPLLQQQLAAFCRQALAGAGHDPAVAVVGGGGGGPDVTSSSSSSPLLSADLFTRVAQLACRQFGAARFEDLVTHGSVAQLLDGAGSVAMAAAGQPPLFAMALLTGSETNGTGEGDAETCFLQQHLPLRSAPEPFSHVEHVGVRGLVTGCMSIEDVLEDAVSLAAPSAPSGASTAAILSYFTAAAALAAGGGGSGGGEEGAVERASPVWAAAASLRGPVTALALPVGSPAGLGAPGALVLVDPAATTNQFG